ncbi:MAG: DUF4437 domain-containing protein [Sandaracinaceae bacterium]
MKTFTRLPLCLFALAACAGTPAHAAETAPTAPTAQPAAAIILTADLDWQQLNPARGDASPMAATVFGDRNGTPATGFMFHAVDGFSSPPHIHNVTYRAVVIRGLVHNDDAAAPPMWMPAGSFWTQPRGMAHITAVQGGDSLAYVEIDEGPYLVRPVDQAFETDEAPVNLDASNVVWVHPERASDAGVRVAYVWGSPEAGTLGGMFVSWPRGRAVLSAGDASLHAVVVDGAVQTPTADGEASLAPGSYLRADAPVQLACAAGDACVLYVRTTGAVSVFASAR